MDRPCACAAAFQAPSKRPVDPPRPHCRLPSAVPRGLCPELTKHRWAGPIYRPQVSRRVRDATRLVPPTLTWLPTRIDGRPPAIPAATCRVSRKLARPPVAPMHLLTAGDQVARTLPE